MNIVFMGTPQFAVPSLERIFASTHAIAAVVTGPDRPRGRGHRLLPTPIAAAAAKLGLPAVKVDGVRSEEFWTWLQRTGADAIVLVAFGHLIPKRILEWPAAGCVNLHPSLLPRYRGAAPIHGPLLAGDSVTGATTIYMDEGLDTGDIILQEEIAIDPWDNAGDLHDRLSDRGADLLVRTLDQIEAGTAPRAAQDHVRASYAPKVAKVRIDWRRPADEVVACIRGLSPSPGAYTFIGERRLKALRAVMGPERSSGRPGEVLDAGERGILVKCGDGTAILLEVQPDGRPAMDASDYARGHPAIRGQHLT